MQKNRGVKHAAGGPVQAKEIFKVNESAAHI